MKQAAEIRMDLARGHAVLGEHLEALQCLERAVQDDPRAPGLLALVEELLEVWGMERERVACRAAGQALREHLLQLLQGEAASPAAAPPAAVEPEPLETEPEPLEADPIEEAELLEAEPLDAEFLEPEEEEAPESFGAGAEPVAAPQPSAADFDWDEPARAAGVEDPALEEPGGFDAAVAPEALEERDLGDSGPLDIELDEPDTSDPAESLRTAEVRGAQVRELERWLSNARSTRSGT